MIITLSGKPCTGKSTLAKLLCDKYGFKLISAGEIFKNEARKLGIDITDLCGSEEIKKIDYKVDEMLKDFYEHHFDEDVVIESRTAWSFMPKAFNVFLDISDEEMASRLFNSNRSQIERGSDINEALLKVKTRYENDVKRYKKIYGIDTSNLNNYTLVINNTNLSPEETLELLWEKFLEFKN